MKIETYLTIFLAMLTTLFSCNTVKSSKYRAFNQFRYASEQPRFNFQNDSLKIEGAWNWATAARAIPTVSYLPKIPLQILKPIAREQGAILFTTWTPNTKKYAADGYVAVTKKDVRFNNNSYAPVFLTVLINDHPFTGDTSKYKPRGRNNDYQFDLYMKISQPPVNNYWVMEIIAASKNRYYDFVCIRDDSFMSKPEGRDYQAGLFLEDIQQRFLAR